MNHKFVREIIKDFSKVGHIEYRFIKDRIDICKDNKIIGMVKDNDLYLVDREEKLIRVTDGSKGLYTNFK